MNQAAIELCRILLEFEIERQQKAAAAGITGQDDKPAVAAEAPQTAGQRQGDSTHRRQSGQKRG